MDSPEDIRELTLEETLSLLPFPIHARDGEKDYDTLVIGGGASKCISAIGALFYLHEKNLLSTLNNFCGTSAGGILCYLTVIGYTPFELIKFMCSSNFIEEFQNLSIGSILQQKGLINYKIVQGYLETLTLNKLSYIPTFRDIKRKLDKELCFTTYNMTLNKLEYLNYETYPDMSCLDAIRMTVNVPILFERYIFNNCEYIDGGIIDNFPLWHYDTPNTKTIGIKFKMSDAVPPNYVAYLLKIVTIPSIFYSLQKPVPKNCTIIDIDPGVQAFDFNLSITKRLDLFSKGYHSAKECLPALTSNETLPSSSVSPEMPE